MTGGSDKATPEGHQRKGRPATKLERRESLDVHWKRVDDRKYRVDVIAFGGLFADGDVRRIKDLFQNKSDGRNL
jgi:hypothetical protein